MAAEPWWEAGHCAQTPGAASWVSSEIYIPRSVDFPTALRAIWLPTRPRNARESEPSQPPFRLPLVMLSSSNTQRSNTQPTSAAVHLAGEGHVPEQGSHTATPARVRLSVWQYPQYILRIQARLLPPFSRQAQRAIRARDRLPDLDPLLEVWERDLLPWEVDDTSSNDQTLPWEGDTFAWEPASRNAVPFTTSRKASSTAHRANGKCHKAKPSVTRRSSRIRKPS
jgi:hypothetical protein